MHTRTVTFADWSALLYTRLRESEQTALTLYRHGYPFATASKASEFHDWFATLNTELFWGDCGRVDTDFQVVRFLFPNKWIAERFEWRQHGRLRFLDGTLETAPADPES